MTRENVRQINARFLRQESEYSQSDHAHTPSRTIQAVNDADKQPFADSYQDSYLCDRADENYYQEKGKADQNNYNSAIILVGSFLLMVLVGLVASNLFPTPSTQKHTTTTTLEDTTPYTTPMLVIEFK